MTERILIGIDGSPAADRALAWGLDDAQRRGAAAHLVSVYSLPVAVGGMMGGYVGPTLTSNEIAEVRDRTTAALAERVKTAGLSHLGVPVTSEVVQGSPAAALLHAAAAADLVVLGTDGAGAVEALFLGSVAHSLAHRASCPVVLVPESSAAGSPRRVVVGVDGSAHSDAAVDVAAREAVLAGVELVVLHAWSYPYRRRHPESDDRIGLEMQADADAVLDAAVNQARAVAPSLDVITTRLVEGSAVDALVGEAGVDDLLVVGARGRGAVRAVLLGSTGSSLIHHARGAVAVVHT